MPRYGSYHSVPLDGVQVGGFEEPLDSVDWGGPAEPGSVPSRSAPTQSAPSRSAPRQPAPAEPGPSSFLVGSEAVRAFVAREWKRRLDYRLKKEVWSYTGNRVSILFEYEWHDAETGQWMLTHGEEHWEIAPDGLLNRIKAAAQDIAIAEIDRWILPKPVMERSAAE